MANTTTYSWDEENRLTSVTPPGGGSEEYSYAADGLRRSKTKGAQTTRFVWDEENLLQEKSGAQTLAHYTNQPDGYGPLLSQRRSDGGGASAAQFNAVAFGSSAFNQSGSTSSTSASSFYGFDLSANTRVLTDESGGVSDRYVNTAFGKPVAISGSTPNAYRFGGEVGYYQDKSDRIYVRARYYSNRQGRWISRDPIGFDGEDWNLYRYVENNPVYWIDPNGEVKRTIDIFSGKSSKRINAFVFDSIGKALYKNRWYEVFYSDLSRTNDPTYSPVGEFIIYNNRTYAVSIRGNTITRITPFKFHPAQSTASTRASSRKRQRTQPRTPTPQRGLLEETRRWIMTGDRYVSDEIYDAALLGASRGFEKDWWWANELKYASCFSSCWFGIDVTQLCQLKRVKVQDRLTMLRTIRSTTSQLNIILNGKFGVPGASRLALRKAIREAANDKRVRGKLLSQARAISKLATVAKNANVAVTSAMLTTCTIECYSKLLPR